MVIKLLGKVWERKKCFLFYNKEGMKSKKKGGYDAVYRRLRSFVCWWVNIECSECLHSKLQAHIYT